MGRAPCCDRDGLKKGPWMPDEDQKLVDYIQKHGQGNWRTLPKKAGLARCGKSCRLRWTNYLRPDIKRGRFSFEEEETIIQLHSMLGNKWSAIAARLPGRTDNEIKNYWNTHIRKRLLGMGIDPVTHTPRLDLLDFSLLTSSLCNPTCTAAPQVDVSRLLGLEPLVNGDLLTMATNLLSSQCQYSGVFAQSLQEAQQQFPPTGSHAVQDQLMSSLQAQQLQYQSPEQLASTLDEAQLVQACSNAGPFPPAADSSPWQQDFVAQAHQLLIQSSLMPATAGVSSYEEGRLDSSFAQLVNDAPYMYGRAYNNNMTSVLSTPASSPTPTPPNSSSTYVHSITEDERDQSYCSNLLKYQIPELLDVSNM